MAMIRASAVREISASSASARIAAALFERTVQIWDLKSGQKVSEFDTVFSFGGRRLALDPSGELCFAAGWAPGKNGGVACYEASSGKLLWHRADLAQTQYLTFSNADATLWWVPETGSTFRLNALNGDAVEQIKGIKSIYDSSYGDVRLMEKRTHDYVVTAKKDFTIARLSFALLDAAIGPDSICICESGGLARCLDLTSGSERWTSDPGKGLHLLRLWYRSEENAFYGVRWEYENGESRIFVRLEGRTGELREVCDLSSSWAEIVSPVLDCLVTSAGSVIGLPDGRLLNCLTFPECDYPD